MEDLKGRVFILIIQYFIIALSSVKRKVVFIKPNANEVIKI